MKNTRKIEYRPDIDGLRAVAILGVLLFHVGNKHFTGGFVGVDVFFVISGFLITGIIKREIETTGTFSAKNFYARRIRRLFPAMFLVLFFTAFFAALVFSPTHLSRTGGALASAIASVSNIYFWLEAGYFDISAKLKPLLHTWSLGVEEQFYFLWPFLLLLLIKMKKSWLPPLFLLLIGIFSLYLNTVFGDGQVAWISRHFPTVAKWIEDGQATIFFLLPFRVFEFAIGALTVWLMHYQTRQWVYEVLFVTGLILIVYAMLTFTDKLLFPSFYGLLPTLGAALVIYSGQKSSLRILLTNKIAVGIGLVSYSLYLIHWPIIVFWNYLRGEISHSIIAVGIIGVSIVIAAFSYRYIEQPFRNRKYDLAKPKWKYSSILAVTMLFFVGLHMKYSNGWTWRLPKSEILFPDAGGAMNFHKKYYGGAGYYGFYPKYIKKPDIILMGDSHGRQYAYGLDKLLVKDKNVSMYVAGDASSIYLPHFARVDTDSSFKASKKVLPEVLKVMQAAKPKMVILSESWLYQMHRADLLDENGKRLHKEITTADIIEGILALKKKIGESTLVVIGNVPGAGYNLYDIFSRPRLPMFSKVDANKYLGRSIKPTNMAFNNALRNAALSSGKFIFLDPHDILCHDGWCKNLDEQKRLIYSDAYHLSRYGSTEVIRGFLPILEKLLIQTSSLNKKEKRY